MEIITSLRRSAVSRLGLAALAAAALVSVAAPDRAAAYHCDQLWKRYDRAWDAMTEAVDLLDAVKDKVKSGAFGGAALRGARQNLQAQLKAFNDVSHEWQEHGCPDAPGEKKRNGDEESGETRTNN